MSLPAQPEPDITMDRVFYWLHRLVDWGHGVDAPDMAKQDWREAREFLREIHGEDFDAS